jgi:phage gp36-like protein
VPDPVYAEISDLAAFGINPNATKGMDPTAIAKMLSAASRKVDGALRPQFKLPLLAWGDEIKEAVCIIVAYGVMSARGFNPENGADKNIRDRYIDIVGDPRVQGSGWLAAVAKGTMIPSVTDSASGSVEGRPSARPLMTSSSQRGWSDPGGYNCGGAPFTGR